ncbi:MAG: N-acetyltransferase [Dehalococcoidales bacterium]|nr:N-acetyltransferase [Dehalococcoidales bacterium]
MDLLIRNERKNEYRAVEELTREAFWNLYVPGCSEHFCLYNMRGSNDFIPELDFVAELNGKVIGNIVYTRGKVIDNAGKTYEVISFGPVSVLPAYQKQGVGSALIKYSLDKAKSLGFTAVLIYGDPRYYHRFGFRCAERYDISNSEGKFAVALMGLELLPGALREMSGRFIESEVYKINENDFLKYENTFPPKDKAVTESQAEFKILVSLFY